MFCLFTPIKAEHLFHLGFFHFSRLYTSIAWRLFTSLFQWTHHSQAMYTHSHIKKQHVHVFAELD